MNKKNTTPRMKETFETILAQRKAALAKNLYLARRATGTTQDDLIGPRVVRTRVTVSKIEGGDGDPRLSSLVSIATSLGISPVLLLLTGDEMLTLASKLEDLKDSGRTVPREDAVALSLAPTETRRQLDYALKLAKRILKPSGPAEQIGTAIGTACRPYEGSLIGRALGMALKAR